VPPVEVDKHKALQILVNILRNAMHAMDEGGGREKILTICIRRNRENAVEISIADTGVGIAPENLKRIFSLGFTTRREGHGFGLHSAALAAQQMGGRLVATSEGPGRGAQFALELKLPTHAATS
jgi:signal transduction histidine kinase